MGSEMCIRDSIMRILFLVAAICVSQCADAFFTPLQLSEKTEQADLIVEATVVSIKPLIRKDAAAEIRGEKMFNMGARSIAMVRVTKIWKQRKAGTTTVAAKHNAKFNLSQLVLIPCDYSFHESPSDLTAGRSYVMFLREMRANRYHPLDPACTHVVHDNRVAKFGMNHSPEMELPIAGKEKFKDRSIPLADFKKLVLEQLNSKRKVTGAEPR